MIADNAGGDETVRGKRKPGSAENPSRFWQDRGLKRILMIRALVADFMLTFQPKYAKRLDLNTLEPRPTELITPALVQRFPDALWRAREKPGPGKSARYVYLILEFQSVVDAKMPERMVICVDALRFAVLVDSPDDESLPWGGVVPLVLYTGEAPWTASRHREIDREDEFSEEHQAPPRYTLVDLGRSPCDGLDGESVFAVVQRIFNAKTLEEAKALWPEMVDRAMARGGEGASAAVAAYLLELLKRRLGGPEDLEAELRAELPGAAEAAEKGDGAVARTMLEANADRWARQWTAEGRAEGLREGRAKGVKEARAEQAAMLLRFSERKFGRAARERLASAATAGSEGLVRMLEWIIDCDTPEELIARVENGPVADQT